jgi:hypothetical protein
MPELRYIAGQVIAFTLFAIGLGYFSNSPSYTHHDPEMALIKLSFSHASQHKEECRRLSPEEIAALAPNMRRPMDCPRERVPVLVEMTMDGNTLLRKSYAPTGLAHDGAASAYEKISVTPGQHKLTVRLRDSNRDEGFDYEDGININLVPLQQFVIDFRNSSFQFY